MEVARSQQCIQYHNPLYKDVYRRYIFIHRDHCVQHCLFLLVVNLVPLGLSQICCVDVSTLRSHQSFWMLPTKFDFVLFLICMCFMSPICDRLHQTPPPSPFIISNEYEICKITFIFYFKSTLKTGFRPAVSMYRICVSY